MPSVTFSAWLQVASARDLAGRVVVALRGRGPLPKTFDAPEDLIDFLTDHGLSDAALNGARRAWRRYANWRARKLGVKPPPSTNEERARRKLAREEREDLIFFGLLDPPVKRSRLEVE